MTEEAGCWMLDKYMWLLSMLTQELTELSLGELKNDISREEIKNIVTGLASEAIDIVSGVKKISDD